MKIFVVSAFTPDTNSGAAGTLDAIGRAWAARGHDVSWGWREDPPRGRIADELFRIPRALRNQVRRHLARQPDTDVVIASQPYAFVAFQSFRPAHPGTLFVNRTHGWEARWIECQNRYGWEPPEGSVSRVLRRPAQTIRAWMCRRAAVTAHGVVAACRADADWIRAAYRLPDWRVAAIAYGNDPAELPPPRPRPDHSGVRFLYAGQYTGRKGSVILEQTLPPLAAAHPDARLTFVVPGPAVAAVEQAYRSAWGDRLTVRAWLPRPQLWDLYATHDAFLFPSYFEGFGKVVIEAMAMGCVVIGFAEGALADLGSPACLTCPVGDAAGFAELLRSVAARRIDPRSLAATAVQDGRRRTWADTADGTIEFFQRLREHDRSAAPASNRLIGR